MLQKLMNVMKNIRKNLLRKVELKKEIIYSGRGTKLRQNDSSILEMSIDSKTLDNIFIINHKEFITHNQKQTDLVVEPHHYYMVINRKNESINITYDKDISNHEILYDPYKYEKSSKKDFNPDSFKLQLSVPDGYIDVLSKWYSIKFTYPTHNLIYIKPEMAISIQVHQERSENWEILKGNPILYKCAKPARSYHKSIF